VRLTKMARLNFRALDWRRLRTALLLGTSFFATMVALGFLWNGARPVLEPLLNAAAMPFFWYYGGITECGLPGLLAVLIGDILLYSAVFYALLTLKHYVRS